MIGELKDRLSDLEESLVGMRIDAARVQLRELLDRGAPPHDILLSLNRGMETVGKKYEECEYFLSDLVMKECLKILEPALDKSNVRNLGTMVLRTVRGDIHDEQRLG
jgi:5-methyltetrahydrofolate--homocysteine methyltransferase